MPQNLEPLENLVDQFARFPGIGRKGATRMAYAVSYTHLTLPTKA